MHVYWLLPSMDMIFYCFVSAHELLIDCVVTAQAHDRTKTMSWAEPGPWHGLFHVMSIGNQWTISSYVLYI